MRSGSTTLVETAPSPHQAPPPVRGIEAEALFTEARKRRRHRRQLSTAIAAVVAVAVAVTGGIALTRHNPVASNTPPPIGGAHAGGVRFYVEQSAAMAPTLLPGDRISVDTRYASLQRGDVVIFDPPSGVFRPPVVPEIKRIIGLPGETISASGNTVFVDGRPLPEPYLRRGESIGPPIATQVIPAGRYFVMGDNRTNSADSRFFGPISARSVIGVVTAIVSPPSRAGLISR
ncbi:MAG: signal peptidase I [Acidimicrobiales bacterium]|jgi:signal peptidase I